MKKMGKTLTEINRKIPRHIIIACANAAQQAHAGYGIIRVLGMSRSRLGIFHVIAVADVFKKGSGLSTVQGLSESEACQYVP